MYRICFYNILKLQLILKVVFDGKSQNMNNINYKAEQTEKSL